MEDTISSTTKTSIVSSSDEEQKCCEKSKIADTDVEEEPEDRISRLPDEMLCNILSAFSTKESVRTSVLSKRWRYVWTSVPNLNLDDYDFFPDKERRNTLDTQNCFVNFMNRVMHLYNLWCIQKFHLRCRYYHDSSNISKWVNTTIGQNVEDIDMDAHLIELPPSFFTCEKLVVLKLESIYFRNVPKSVNFPHLKIVRFSYVEFSDVDSVKNFLSGCQVLEELDIIECANVYTLCIQSSTLKKLSVEFEYEGQIGFEYSLVIESPNLHYLHLTNCVTENYNVNFQPSLVEAHLSITEDRYVRKNDFNCDRFIKLLQNISNTKHLEVVRVPMDSATATLSVSYFRNLPVFLNLTCLKVVVSDDSWDVLPFLLEFSPHLHTCFIDKMVNDYYPCECKWKSPYYIPKCLLLCLEEIVITGFEACNNEMEMVEYFLKNGSVLKKMMIKSVKKLRSEEKSTVHKNLLTFLKASSACQISFS